MQSIVKKDAAVDKNAPRETAARITKNSIIRISYLMADAHGEVIDEVPQNDPFEFHCGAGQLLTGFERALMGLRAGERKEFTIQAGEAYGERNQELVRTVARTTLPRDVDVREGMRFPMRSAEGVELVCRILSVQSDVVTADFNHPLAGQALRCSVSVVEVKNTIP